MKTIIAGTRTITDPYLLEKAIAASGFAITEVVYGGARGVDELGKQWAERQNPPIPVATFDADWDLYGKKAGPIRNQLMVDYAQAAVVLWDEKSDGTADLLRRVRAEGLRLHLSIFREIL